MRKVLPHATYTQIQVHLVIVWSDVGVTNRPIVAVAISAFCFEVIVGQSERQPPPNIGLTAQASRTDPGVVGSCDGILALIHHDVLHVVAVANVAVQMLVVFESGTIRRIADGVFIQTERMRVWWKSPAILIVVRPFHGAHFLLDVQFFPGFEEQDLEPVAGKNMRCHSARCTGSDHDCIVGFTQIYLGFSHIGFSLFAGRPITCVVLDPGPLRVKTNSIDASSAPSYGCILRLTGERSGLIAISLKKTVCFFPSSFSKPIQPSSGRRPRRGSQSSFLSGTGSPST